MFTAILDLAPNRPASRQELERQENLVAATEELAGELGPLPPMKIHCAQLVEGALRSALTPPSATPAPVQPAASTAPTLLDSFSKPKEGVKLTFLDEAKE